jgi:CubicO group peptidase (beta-lactamase class C family)
MLSLYLYVLNTYYYVMLPEHRRLRYVPEAKPFRDGFIYNNWMYMLAGHVTEKLSGAPWEQMVKQKIWDPLGMTSTKILTTPDDVTSGNVAKPYLYMNDTFINATAELYT